MNEIPSNTFYQDFEIANRFGANAILDTYKRATKEWQHDYKMITALDVALNHQIWSRYEQHDLGFAQIYNDLWEMTYGKS